MSPRFEAFGGFSYFPANGDDFSRQNSTGFQASLTTNVNRWFGVVADLGGQYSSASWFRGPGVPSLTTRTSVCEYLFGPRFTMRAERASIFGHALVGQERNVEGHIDLRDNQAHR